MTRGASRGGLALLTAAGGAAASVATFWPGFAQYDTVAQYGQVLSGEYDDWHPPIMARLWSGLAPLGPGAAPMLVLQLALYWLGFALIAGTLARTGRARAAVAVLGIALLPPFLGWQAVVLKDAQMTGALLAAIGIVVWWRLRGMRMPIAAGTAVAVLVAYATLVRGNAVFASVPLAVALLPRPRRMAARIALGIAATAAVLAASPAINQRLLGAEPSGVQHVEALYDLAGIAARVPDARDTGLTAAEARFLVDHHCLQSFFWDPLGDPDRCEPAVTRLEANTPGTLYVLLARSALQHPLAYAAHRLTHLDSTERWLVPAHWIGAAPPLHSEANADALGNPGAVAIAWQRLAGWLVETPLGWPFAWATLAVVVLFAAWPRPATAMRSQALALLASALTLEASFAVLSIASDLRYHLWSMIATALAAVLIVAERPPTRRVVIVGGIMLALAIGIAVAARLALPAPPQTYRAMLA